MPSRRLGVNCHCVALISTPIGAELIDKIIDFGVKDTKIKTE
ncbi:MAG: hypothetical protein SO386_06860 [Eubacteriales bacterium]|nr:hypothetical protein [Eubacteriales bacterium]